MLGETIFHYKILEKLGQGGMGEVFLAEDTRRWVSVDLKSDARSCLRTVGSLYLILVPSARLAQSGAGSS
jgi:serine/threonine protein kinase